MLSSNGSVNEENSGTIGEAVGVWLGDGVGDEVGEELGVGEVDGVGVDVMGASGLGVAAGFAVVNIGRKFTVPKLKSFL